MRDPKEAQKEKWMENQKASSRCGTVSFKLDCAHTPLGVRLKFRF